MLIAHRYVTKAQKFHILCANITVLFDKSTHIKYYRAVLVESSEQELGEPPEDSRY